MNHSVNIADLIDSSLYEQIITLALVDETVVINAAKNFKFELGCAVKWCQIMVLPDNPSPLTGFLSATSLGGSESAIDLTYLQNPNNYVMLSSLAGYTSLKATYIKHDGFMTFYLGGKNIMLALDPNETKWQVLLRVSCREQMPRTWEAT